jgi:hypothetical protein
MFCNSTASASIPSRALISFSRVRMVVSFTVRIEFWENPNPTTGGPVIAHPAPSQSNLSGDLYLSSSKDSTKANVDVPVA